MKNDFNIRLEKEKDHREVENLTREAFWNVYRPGCVEHYILHTFRKDPAFVPELNFVMEKGGRIIGHVMYARSEICADDGRRIPIMTFGPISIAPEYKRQGYGSRVVRPYMQAPRQLGAGARAINRDHAF